MSRQCENGVLALGPQQAADRLQHINSPISNALRNFLLTIPPKRARDLAIFEASYRYGQLIVGPRFGTHKFSKVLAPCSSAHKCESCDRFLSAFHYHRPLAIVKQGSCEEYLEYEQSLTERKRQAPLRFYSQGEIIGTTRLLNQVLLPQKPIRLIFGQAARRMTAGARSIFLTASVSNPHIAKWFPKSVLKMHGLDSMTSRKLGKHLDENHSLFFRLMEDASVLQLERQAWRTRMLFISVEGLSTLLATFSESAEAKTLLSAILCEYFLESRNTRSDFMRHMVVADCLSDRQISSYVTGTIHHIIEVIRGEFPGFVPHTPRLRNDFGPFDTVYAYLNEAKTISPKTMRDFPMVLRPMHLGQNQPFVYYSFERPTLLAPVVQNMSIRSFIPSVEDGLKNLADYRHGLFDSAKWKLFVSRGKPQGPGSRKQSM
jgi:hypothetical protein